MMHSDLFGALFVIFAETSNMFANRRNKSKSVDVPDADGEFVLNGEGNQKSRGRLSQFANFSHLRMPPRDDDSFRFSSPSTNTSTSSFVQFKSFRGDDLNPNDSITHSQQSAVNINTNHEPVSGDTNNMFVVEEMSLQRSADMAEGESHFDYDDRTREPEGHHDSDLGLGIVLEPPAEWRVPSDELSSVTDSVETLTYNETSTPQIADDHRTVYASNTDYFGHDAVETMTTAKPPVPKKPEYLRSFSFRKSDSKATNSSVLSLSSGEGRAPDTPQSARKQSIIIMEEANVRCQNGNVCQSSMSLMNVAGSRFDLTDESVDKKPTLGSGSSSARGSIINITPYSPTPFHARSKSASTSGAGGGGGGGDSGYSATESPGGNTLRSESAYSWDGYMVPGAALGGRQRKTSLTLSSASSSAEYDRDKTLSLVSVSSSEMSYKTAAKPSGSLDKPSSADFAKVLDGKLKKTASPSLGRAKDLSSDKAKSNNATADPGQGQGQARRPKKLQGLQNWYQAGIGSLFRSKKTRNNQFATGNHSVSELPVDNSNNATADADCGDDTMTPEDEWTWDGGDADDNYENTEPQQQQQNHISVRDDVIINRRSSGAAGGECCADVDCRCMTSPWLLVAVDHWDKSFVSRWLASESLEELHYHLPGESVLLSPAGWCKCV